MSRRPGVLAVDLEQVLGQQVVVARHGRLGARTAAPRESPRPARRTRRSAGHAKAALGHDRAVAGLDGEHVEVVAEAPRAVQAPADGGDGDHPALLAQRVGGHRPPGQELDDERVLAREVGDHGCADADLGGPHRVLVLVVAIDREQPRVVAPVAHDVRPVVGADLVVGVRAPADESGDLARVAQLGNELAEQRDQLRLVHGPIPVPAARLSRAARAGSGG